MIERRESPCTLDQFDTDQLAAVRQVSVEVLERIVFVERDVTRRFHGVTGLLVIAPGDDREESSAEYIGRPPQRADVIGRLRPMDCDTEVTTLLVNHA